MFISHQTPVYGYLDSIRLALEGGIRFVQLRVKDVDKAKIISIAEKAKAECDKYNAMLIIDDYADLVCECKLDGVHLGKDDMPVADARKMLGKSKIIGATANSYNDILAAVNAGADYIGLGPYAFTRTKNKLSPILGLAGCGNVIAEMRKNNIHTPVYAIGGITLDDVKPLIECGMYGIAVSSAILSTENPVLMAKEFANFAF